MSRFADVELATLEYGWWFHNHGLLKTIGLLAPAESDGADFNQLHTPAQATGDLSVGAVIGSRSKVGFDLRLKP